MSKSGFENIEITGKTEEIKEEEIKQEENEKGDE